MITRKDVSKAADLIERYGLAKYRYSDDEDGFCMVGALFHVKGLDPYDLQTCIMFFKVMNKYDSSFSRAVRLVLKKGGIPTSSILLIHSDSRKVKKEQAVSELRKIARLM